VFEEVLPAVRKTGSYSLPSAQQSPSLTPDDRNAIGGIVKRGCAAQIRPLTQMQAVDHARIVALNQHIVALTQEIAALKAAPVATPVQRVAEGGVPPAAWPQAGWRCKPTLEAAR
jgi:hypothetical protein